MPITCSAMARFSKQTRQQTANSILSGARQAKTLPTFCNATTNGQSKFLFAVSRRPVKKTRLRALLLTLTKRDSLSPTMSFLAIILVVFIAVLAAANVYAYWRSRPGPPETLYYFKCPKCRQRLRYRARQAGNPGMCRRCKEKWTFPPVPSN